MTEEKFIASMVLAAVGDAIGYKNGSWEFNMSGESIHAELKQLGGLGKLEIDKRDWRVSDDTIMHMATAKALSIPYKDFDELMSNMAKEYIECWSEMSGRAPGGTCGQGVRYLQSKHWNEVPYSKYGGGCGGSMRSSCIGLKFHSEKDRDMLIATSIESGRLSHTHPNGFLGSMVASVFTAFAIEGIAPLKWGYLLMNDIMPQARKYLETVGRDWEEIKDEIKPFENKWKRYLKIRKIEDGSTEPSFPKDYGIKERDAFYHIWAFAGWPGASGDDSVIIAYDAILGANGNWEELMLRGALHCGDSDSTGTICAAWFGAMHGFDTVFKINYENVEFKGRIENLTKKLLH
jgi:ADP-ribosylarginine hydrolase